MNYEFPIIDPTSLPGINSIDVKQKEYAEKSKAENTQKAYFNDWKHFETWCTENGLISMPAEPLTVSRYITTLASIGYKTSTIQRRIASISTAHQMKGYASPTHDVWLRMVLTGIKNEHGSIQKGKEPVMIEDLRLMVDTLPDTLHGHRDRALLVIGFAGGFRRSEIVGLDVEDIKFVREGLVVHLKRSKTDQAGEGRKVAIPYGSRIETCPVRSLQKWLEEALITSGPLFRRINRWGQLGDKRLSDKSVALIVKRTADETGLTKDFSGHSLRAGFATTAASRGASERKIMDQTGHITISVARRYIRDGDMFRDNAASYLGL